jgi:hypothetical protein
MIIDKRFAPFLNALLMAIILPFFMTFVVTLVNIGFTDKLVASWMRTWGIASIAAFPLILVLAPMIRKIVAWATA